MTCKKGEGCAKELSATEVVKFTSKFKDTLQVNKNSIYKGKYAIIILDLSMLLSAIS